MTKKNIRKVYQANRKRIPISTEHPELYNKEAVKEAKHGNPF